MTDFLSHLAGELLQARLGGGAGVPLGLATVCLRDRHARAVLVEPPAVVRAREGAVALHAPLRQRRQTVRAAVFAGQPLPFAHAPEDEPAAQELHPVRPVGLEVALQLHRPPVLVPLELPGGEFLAGGLGAGRDCSGAHEPCRGLEEDAGGVRDGARREQHRWWLGAEGVVTIYMGGGGTSWKGRPDDVKNT